MQDLKDYPQVQSLLPQDSDTTTELLAVSKAPLGDYLIVGQSDDESGGSYLVFAAQDGTVQMLAADTTVFPISVATVPAENIDELADQMVGAEIADTARAATAFAAAAGLDSPLAGLGEEFPADLERAMRRALGGTPFAARAAGQTNNALIYASALKYLGNLSSRNAPGTGNGNKACAWAVNRVVNDALGRPVGGGLSTANMDVALRNGRGERVSQSAATAGSIIISPTALRNGKPVVGHVGILGKSGLVYSNSSSQALWVQNYTVAAWHSRYEDKGLDVKFYNVV